MAVNLGPFTVIKDVQWAGGATFVACTSAGPFHIKLRSKGGKQEWGQINVPPSSVGSPIICEFVTYFDSLFVMVGIFEYPGTPSQNGQGVAVLTSPDGTPNSWVRTWESEMGVDYNPLSDTYSPIISGSCGIVMQEESFWLQMTVQRLGLLNPIPGVTWRQDQTYNSTHAVEWQLSSAVQIPYGGELEGYRSSFPQHCTQNNLVDDFGQNVPDGYLKRDVRYRGLEVKPEGAVKIYYGAPALQYTACTSYIVSSTAGTRNTGLAKCNCVAGANKIWVAAGRGGFAESFDVGRTWQGFGPQLETVTNIAGARNQEVTGGPF
jgi:hypothetical protein